MIEREEVHEEFNYFNEWEFEAEILKFLILITIETVGFYEIRMIIFSRDLKMRIFQMKLKFVELKIHCFLVLLLI